MLNLRKRTKIIITTFTGLLVLTATPFILYLKVLPAAVSNPKVIACVQNSLQKYAKLDLKIKNPLLKTELSPVISFKVDELSLKKGSDNLVEVDNFDTQISFKKLLQKDIIVKKLGADYIFADVNKLTD